MRGLQWDQVVFPIASWHRDAHHSLCVYMPECKTLVRLRVKDRNSEKIYLWRRGVGSRESMIKKIRFIVYLKLILLCFVAFFLRRLALQLLLALWLFCLLTSAWETLCPVTYPSCLLRRLQISFSRGAKKSGSGPSRDKVLLSLSFAHFCTESAPVCYCACLRAEDI